MEEGVFFQVPESPPERPPEPAPPGEDGDFLPRVCFVPGRPILLILSDRVRMIVVRALGGSRMVEIATASSTYLFALT